MSSMVEVMIFSKSSVFRMVDTSPGRHKSRIWGHVIFGNSNIELDFPDMSEK